MRERSRAIVPAGHNPIASPSVVGVVDGRVLSAVVCIERRLRGSLFIARVLNNSTYPVFCSVYVESRRGISALHPFEFRVDAGGTEDAAIAVPRRMIAPFRRVIISMRGTGLEYKIDAQVPPWRAPAPVRWIGAAAVLVLALFAMRAGSISVGAVPQRVRTGQVVRIPYSAYGLGNARYTVVRDGKPVAAGRLSGGSGTLEIASGERAGTLAARISLSQLGIERETQSSTIAIATPLPPPQIENFAVETTQAHPGDRINVRYRVAAQHASLSLLDAAGSTLESMPLGSGGIAVLTAPAVSKPSQFILRLDAQRGGTRTQSQVQVAVAPLPTPSPPPSAAPGDMAPLSADRVVQLGVRDVRGGHALPVRILMNPNGITLTLQDPSGKALTSTAVAPGDTMASLIVPPVAHDAQFLLVVTLQTGQGEQSLLLPVPVRAGP